MLIPLALEYEVRYACHENGRRTMSLAKRISESYGLINPLTVLGRVDQSILDGNCHRVGRVLGTQFLQDALHVFANRGNSHVHIFGGIKVGVPLTEEKQDFLFPDCDLGSKFHLVIPNQT